MDCPIQKILSKPDLAGRLSSWSIELSEFSIRYEPHGPIKAHMLNLTKVTSQLKFKNPWTHMIVVLCRLNIVPSYYNAKIITFTRLRTKSIDENKSQESKEQINLFKPQNPIKKIQWN